MTGRRDGFSVTVDFDVRQVVARVHGETDMLTSPGLGRLLAAVVDGGQANVVLDLAEVDFMDVSAVHVIAELSTRVALLGGSLTLRSPSPMVQSLLRRTGVEHIVSLEPAEAASALGTEQRTGDGSLGGANEATPAWAHATLPLGLPLTNDVVDAALRLVVSLARATVGGADGVSVSLHRHGQLTTVAASDETISQMDRDQYATAQGPCVSAANEGRWFHVEALSAETRWPEFIPRAMAGGIRSILSTPLMLDERPLGALNIYSNAESAFGPEEQMLAALFATQASGILADAGVGDTTKEAWGRLQDALHARELIAHAQGVLMAREGISAEAAYALMRDAAQAEGAPLREYAAHVVDAAIAGRPEPNNSPHG